MEEEIFSTVLTVSALVLLLSGVVITVIMNYKRKQQDFIREKKQMHESFARQLLESKMEIQEHTFSQIGSELHDNIGQLLTSSRMLLAVGCRSLGETPAALLEAEATLVSAMQEVRSLSRTLNKEWLSRFNLVENLTREVSRINQSTSLKATLQTDCEELPMGTEEQVILFRILQESIQNAIRHGNPQHLTITISCVDQLTLVIEDDGIGIKNLGDGVGIMNMKHRTELLKGQIAWTAGENNGTRVLITLPVNV